MFWKKKRTPKSKKISETPKQALILKAYLSISMALLSESGKLSTPVAKAGLQVFILGMTDMLRQAEKLDWQQFIDIYKVILTEYDLLPSITVEVFIQKIEQLASTNSDIEKVMRQGAQSIRMYVVERDADAPTDLFGAVIFAESNEDIFKIIANANNSS